MGRKRQGGKERRGETGKGERERIRHKNGGQAWKKERRRDLEKVSNYQ
jgi:hypothetical protein